MTGFLDHLPYAAAAFVLLCGLYGIVTSRNLVHLVGCVAVLQSATYLLLVALGYRKDGTAPVFADAPPGKPVVDPLVQALMLTDVVVEATVVALLLAIAVQAHKSAKSLDPERLRIMRG